MCVLAGNAVTLNAMRGVAHRITLLTRTLCNTNVEGMLASVLCCLVVAGPLFSVVTCRRSLEFASALLDLHFWKDFRDLSCQNLILFPLFNLKFALRVSYERSL